MAETEAGAQTWVSTGRGGAGNFPYTPRALSKRPVTLSSPQGREVDYRKQSVARSGRNGVGFWEPTPDEAAKQQEAEEFTRDQELIKEHAIINKRNSLAADGSHVFRSGRGGYGSYAPPKVTEERLPTHHTIEAPELPQEPVRAVQSSGKGNANLRSGDFIPLVNMNRAETTTSTSTAMRSSPSAPPVPAESGLSTFISYTTAFFNALTPAENRIENMKASTTTTTTSTAPSKRTSFSGAGGGGRGGANKYGYSTYTPTSTSSPVSGGSTSGSRLQSAHSGVPKLDTSVVAATNAHSQAERGYSAYTSSSYASRDRQLGSDMLASSSSSGAGSSHWATSPSSSRSVNDTPASPWSA